MDTVLIERSACPRNQPCWSFRESLIEHVILPVLPPDMVDDQLKVYVNPTGRFVIGGPMGDSGVTGRKIIVDTYGGMGRHGGSMHDLDQGMFSGIGPFSLDVGESMTIVFVRDTPVIVLRVSSVRREREGGLIERNRRLHPALMYCLLSYPTLPM